MVLDGSITIIDMPGKILVLGATGHVGAPLVTELVASMPMKRIPNGRSNCFSSAQASLS
jgi:hypothetical protein